MTQRFPLTHALQNAMPLPRDNGELIFHSPWESRVFAMAVLLCEKGAYTWNTFNEHFVQCIGEAERHNPTKDMVKNNFPTCLSCSILTAG